ncbi:MAG TPA: phage portal protein [Actinomycetota bacterium]|nr:phage portal protein [Actinomycetota bacterium]
MTEPLDWARVPYDTLARDRRVAKNLTRWVTMQERLGRVVRKRVEGDVALFESFENLRTLSIDELPDIATQIGRLRGGVSARPWRVSSQRDALGFPAIFRAASLIANTTGSLAMRALRNEVQLEPQDRPRIIVRPDPNRTPRDFYRDTAWNLARAGEGWWYVSKRNTDDKATSLYNVPDPAEVQVEPNDDDPVRPHITWRRKSTRDGTLRRDDMRQLTFLPDTTGLRGAGPLQYCGAAVSVAVESQEWAANFYAAGGYPNIWIKAAGSLGGDDDGWSTDDQSEDGAESEAERLKLAWVSSPPNTPKVTDEGIIDIKQFDPNPNGAQMLDARNYQTGEASRMFGIPGSLLEYQSEGSSLTYQNLEGEFTKFIRGCLRIGYLETIEQTMSDLLTGSTVSLFNTEQLEAPDVKTRFEVYQLAKDVFGEAEAAEYARKREGLAPGNVENAPVPFALPVSVPRVASLREIRCPSCSRLVGRAEGRAELYCRHCKSPVAAA